MKSYDYHKQLKEVWEHAVAQYREGNRDSSTYFQGKRAAFVESIGATAQEIYDFAEDWVNYGDPDYETFALLADIRRNHFLIQQKGKRSRKVLKADTLPAKTDKVRGIEWLPRIIPKAKAKLRGELPKEIMYGCGGDRRFFRENNLHPAEFLRLVELHMDDDKPIVAYVARKRRQA